MALARTISEIWLDTDANLQLQLVFSGFTHWASDIGNIGAFSNIGKLSTTTHRCGSGLEIGLPRVKKNCIKVAFLYVFGLKSCSIWPLAAKNSWQPLSCHGIG